MFPMDRISQIARRLARGASLLLGSIVAQAMLSTVAGAADPAPAAVHGAAPAAAAKFVEIPATPDLLRKLRDGGYVLYLRHGATDNAIPDRVPAVDLSDCSTQRPLTPAGRTSSAAVGEAMRKAKIPIGELRVSPLCRARHSAAAAFPNVTMIVDDKLMYVANLTAAQKAPIIENTRQLLSAPVPAGSNRVIVAHAPNLMELIGYFPKECTLIVFRRTPDGGFEYIASVAPGAWTGLLR